MAKSKTGKVTNIKKYRRPLNINIGMLIFAAIFVYIVICIVMYIKQDPITPYVVQEGFLSTNNVYTGMALRDETVVTAKSAGYVNYYAREGERVAVGNLVYTVDETGRLNDFLTGDEPGENALSDKELAQLKSEIVNFEHGFSPYHFSTTYDFKFAAKGTVMKLANSSLMSNIRDINHNSEMADLVDFCYSGITGIVEYWTDGYEELTPDMVTAKNFERKNYEKNQLLGNNLVAQDESVYKVCTSEEWSLVFPIEEKKGQELLKEEYIKVRFLKNQDEAWGKVGLLYNSDGTYLELQFNNSMLTFAGERYLDIEMILNESAGLKIPNSSVVEREFFLIPEGYVTQSGSNKSYGVFVRRHWRTVH